MNPDFELPTYETFSEKTTLVPKPRRLAFDHELVGFMRRGAGS